MDCVDKNRFGRGMAFKLSYAFSVLFFVLLCAYRLVLLFTPTPGILTVLPVFLGLTAAYLLLCRRLDKAGGKGGSAFYILTSAFFCTYGFAFFMDVEKSLIWLLIYATAAFFLHFAMEECLSRKVSVTALFLGFVFAVFIFLGAQLEQHGRLEMLYILDEPVQIFRMLLGLAGNVMCFTAVLALGFNRCMNIGTQSGWKHRGLPVILLMALGILLCWLPYYYAFYPGNLSPDSISELEQQLGMAPLSNHHPYLHQLVIALCLRLGAGSLEQGIGVYTALQMSLLALCFALCVYLLGEMGVNKYIRGGVFAFFALFSVNAFYSVTLWKDVLHGAAALLLMLLLVLEVKDGQKEKGRLARAGLIALAAFLFCTLRNNGWYAFILGFPFFILCNRKYWKRLSALFAVVVLMVSAYNHLIFDVMGIKKSASGEALSVPLQQIARTVSQNPHQLDDEEYVVLREVFPEIESLGDKYVSFISDPVKAPETFRSDVFSENPTRYLREWAKLGLKHPVTYVEAFLLQCYGYWYPDVDYWIIHNTIEENELGLSHRPERFALRHELSMLAKDITKELPTAILFSLGLMVWLVIIAAALLCLKGQGRLASPLWIMAMFWLTTLASPVYCEYRYLYGLVVSVPLFFGLALGVKAKTE